MITPERWVRALPAAALGSVFLLVISVQALAIAQTWGGLFWVPGAATGALVCALALIRHRKRTRTAVAGLAVAALAVLVPMLPGTRLPAGLGPSTALGLAVLIASAVRALPAERAAGIAGGGTVVVAAQFAARPLSAVPFIAGAVLLAALGAGLSLRMLDNRARAAEERLRRAERLDLARELHDVVAHHITGMLIQAQAARIVARRSPERIPESLADIEAAGAEAMAAMRRVVGLLRDTGATDGADATAPASPGPESLSALVERFGRQGPAVRLSVPGDGDPWPPEVTSTVYRVVQEALTNVLRHARHTRSVEITVGRAPGAVTVEVVDDAPPRSVLPRPRAGYGLIGMRERVETLGGSLVAGPRPGGGWAVRATLPLHLPTGRPG
ncbi:sensor histidine kinase [Streptomyces sp. NPDC001985]|uniref:sensor histidine kinase n=1 Tax=Streptomyces sp. NPDC001985 TaxID=3154406 RepID=UPI0033200F28